LYGPKSLPTVWIRYYGLIPMTRRGYLIALTAACVIAVVVIGAAALLGRMPPLETVWSPDARVAHGGIVALCYNYGYLIIIACLVAQAIDTYCTLRLFAKREAEELARLAALAQDH
jgi:hypothetical protein